MHDHPHVPDGGTPIPSPEIHASVPPGSAPVGLAAGGPLFPPPGLAPPTLAPRPNPWPVVAAVLIGVAGVAVTVGGQVAAWLVEQFLLVAGLTSPAWLAPAASAMSAVLLGGAATLLATLPQSPALRQTGRAWALSAAALAVLSLPRAIPLPHHELYLVTVAVLAGLAALLLRRRRRDPDRASPAAMALGLAAGCAVLLPWLGLGALGGALETVLAIVAAVAVGLLAAAILDHRFWAAFTSPSGSSTARLVLLGGSVAGVALAVLAGAVGHRGAQLPALLVLPAAGFAAAALVAHRRSSAPVGVLVATAAVGPLAFLDPEEISLTLLMERDVPFWSAVAAGLGLVIALLAGVVLALTTHRQAPRRGIAIGAAVATLASGTAVHIGFGVPGLHGDRLFVILKEQADLSTVTGPPGQAGRDARAREVYGRLVAHARDTQAALRRDLRRFRLPHRPYYLINAIEVEGGPLVRAWLSRRPDVDRVLVSQEARPLPAAPPIARGSLSAPDSPTENVTMLHADQVWSKLGVTGSGIVIGASDSGVDAAHPALASRFRGGDDSWYDPWNHTRQPQDRDGHGTHTVAIAVGTGGVGIAPDAQWVGCVNLYRNLGNPARYLDCLQFMLAPFPPGGDPFTDGRPERAPHILTNSWGCPPIEGCDPEALAPATAALKAAGIFVVAAAGNTGPFCGSVQDPPATHPDVLTVGAVDPAGKVSAFSSRGPTSAGVVKPDVVAPGEDVLSAMPGGGYAKKSGTSMAAPHVAGVVALMWSAAPDLIGDVDTTTRLLRETARPVRGEQGCGQPENHAGAGLVDAYAAVLAARRG